jgi:branched-chain amino acid transport system ATP-binding protein
VYEIFPRLAERGAQRARTLSGGERRMLALGRGLMTSADLLMIDEPSLGLAPVLVDEVYDRIARIAAGGVTVLLVEENFAHVREVADRVILIENGSVVLSGTVDEVLENPAVTATYLGVGGE